MTMLMGRAPRGRFPAYPFALDGISGVISALGFQTLIPGYSGPLITLRRTSDNATQDFYAVPSTGRLNVEAVLAWVGGGGAFGTRWWDQTGISTNYWAGQATVADQPRLVNAGVMDMYGGLPAWFSPDQVHGFGSVWPTTTVTPLSFVSDILCADYTLANPQEIIRGQAGSPGITLLRIETNGRASIYSGTLLQSGAALVDGSAYVIGGVLNGAASAIGVSGTWTTGTAGTTQTIMGAPVIMRGSPIANGVQGYMGSLVTLSRVATTAELDGIGRKIAAARGIAHL